MRNEAAQEEIFENFRIVLNSCLPEDAKDTIHCKKTKLNNDEFFLYCASYETLAALTHYLGMEISAEKTKKGEWKTNVFILSEVENCIAYINEKVNFLQLDISAMYQKLIKEKQLAVEFMEAMEACLPEALRGKIQCERSLSSFILKADADILEMLGVFLNHGAITERDSFEMHCMEMVQNTVDFTDDRGLITAEMQDYVNIKQLQKILEGFLPEWLQERIYFTYENHALVLRTTGSFIFQIFNIDLFEQQPHDPKSEEDLVEGVFVTRRIDRDSTSTLVKYFTENNDRIKEQAQQNYDKWFDNVYVPSVLNMLEVARNFYEKRPSNPTACHKLFSRKTGLKATGPDKRRLTCLSNELCQSPRTR